MIENPIPQPNTHFVIEPNLIILTRWINKIFRLRYHIVDGNFVIILNGQNRQQSVTFGRK